MREREFAAHAIRLGQIAAMATTLEPRQFRRRLQVLIADDHKLIVEAIKSALEQSSDFEVVGEATSGSQVLPLVGRTNPDLVLLDLRMPGADGLTCLSQIRKRYPHIKVVMLSGTSDESVIQTALNRGASAYIVKTINPIDLPSALRQAIEGTVYSAIGLPTPTTAPLGRRD
jgi:DNA-binding NarL/FixJ family response regulator